MSGKIGWIGLDVPLELIEAAGSQPVWLRAEPAHPGAAADPYTEGGGHPLVRALAAVCLAQGAAGLRELVIGATPVAQQTLFHFLRSLPPGTPLPRLHLLQLLHRHEAWCGEQNLAELRQLNQSLGVAAAALPAAIAARNQLRQALRRLETRRRALPPSISGGTMLRLYAQAGTTMAATLLPRLQALLAAPATPLPQRARLLLCGSAAAVRELYAAFENAGCQIVSEDHDEGERSAGPLVRECGDPWQALAEAYAGRAPAAAGWSTEESTMALLDRVAESAAEAVVFHIPGFEHPDGWDFPSRRDALEQRGIPYFMLPPGSFRSPDAAAASAVAALLPLLGRV